MGIVRDKFEVEKVRHGLAFRIAPSPTGQMHIGTVGMALCDYMLAKSLGGKFYIRIEDTDQKREVEGVADELLRQFKVFGFEFDNEPIYQSKRGEIYKRYADRLIAEGKAYVDEGAVRFRAPEKTTVTWHDMVKGDMALPGLERDPVIVKSTGIPPYNLAHVVDDTLMGVTHVVRGEEWLPSTAEHIQLFEALGLTHPHYAHLPVISILDNGNKRKLSKRKDKEALAQNFLDAGYPVDALIEYLLTIYNTDYELWRTANPDKPWREFNFRFEKIGSSSPLFDWAKLNDISKNLIARMTCKEIDHEVKEYFKKTGEAITDEEYRKVCALLAVDRGTVRPRKDITKFGDIKTEFDYVFRPVERTPLIMQYETLFTKHDTRDSWFEKVKAYCVANNLKVRDYTQQIRVALTGREHSTDLYTISTLLLK